MILCTQKDWGQMRPDPRRKPENFVFAYLAMELDFVEGFDKISTNWIGRYLDTN